MTRPWAAAGVLAILVTAGGFLAAQDTKEPTPRVRGTLPPSWSRLGLTDQQKQQIYATQNAYRARIDNLRQQMRNLERQQRAEMERILTDAQRTRLRELIAEKAGIGSPPKEDNKKTETKATAPEKKP
jgi:hypothetical protein